MKNLVRFPVESGSGSVVVEVADVADADGRRRVSRSDDVIREASQTFEKA